jgi:Ca2+-binding RTX toxin-like protein
VLGGFEELGQITGTKLDDSIVVGSNTSATIDGSLGDDTVAGGAAQDSLHGSAGNDLIHGFANNDTASGGADDDVLRGGLGDDDLWGGTGADRLEGGDGADALLAEEGPFGGNPGLSEDTLIGGDGADTLVGAYGDDMDGGKGLDRASIDWSNLFEGVEADLSAAFANGTSTVGPATYTRLESLTLSATNRNDRVTIGDAGALGGSGAVFARGGHDTVTGGAGANVFVGDGGDDVLRGLGNADTLYGEAGADVLWGGDGADSLIGGFGVDRFGYAALSDSAGDGLDLITDLANEDRIDLSLIDAKANKGGNQAFTLVDELSGAAGEAALVYDGALDQTRLLLNVDGDAEAEMVVVIAGDHSAFTNFVL